MNYLTQEEMNKFYEERLQKYDIVRIANLQRPEVKEWILRRLETYQYYKKNVVPTEDKINTLKNKKYNEDLDHDTMMELSREIQKLEKELYKHTFIYETRIEVLKNEQHFRFIPLFVEIDLQSKVLLKKDILFYTYLANKQ